MGGFNNPLVGGGGGLVYPSIHSPNFVMGSAGWSIKKDGSAEFNNVIIRNGQVVSGTELFYNGVPAAGNLIASVSAAAGVDGFGNAYVGGGFASYGPAAGADAILTNGGLILDVPHQAAGLHGSLFVTDGVAAGSPPALSLSPPSNRNEAGANSQANIILVGESTDGTHLAQILLESTQVGAANVQAVQVLCVGGNLVYAAPGVAPANLVPETFHSLGSTGLAGDAGNARYRFTVEGELQISIHKSFNALGAITTVNFPNALPAAYIPAAAQLTGGEPVALNGAAPGAGTRLTITGGTGVVNLVNLPAATTAVGIDVRIPLA